MAIEPLGSAMTFQAQTTQQAKPVQKTVVENTDVATPEQVNAYDATTAKVAETDQQATNNEQIRKAVEKMNKSMSNSEAIFGIHDATNRVTIKIVDKETKEVLKEIPPEKTLDMIAKAWELAGILVDEKR